MPARWRSQRACRGLLTRTAVLATYFGACGRDEPGDKPQGSCLVWVVSRTLLTGEEGEVLQGGEGDDPLSRIIFIVSVVEPAHEVMRPADRTDGQKEFVSAIASRPAAPVFVAQGLLGHGAPPLFRLCERRSQGALKNSYAPR